MNAKLSIDIAVAWIKKPGECNPCVVCGDLIYGERYNLELTCGHMATATSVNICTPCFEKSIEDATR